MPLAPRAAGHPLHGLASRGAELCAPQGPREAAARGGRHPDARRAGSSRAPTTPCDLPFPLIVKPVREDGSVGIWRTSVVHGPGELARAVEAVVTTFRQPALVEQFIDGREFNVALLGHPTPRVLPAERDRLRAPCPTGAPRIVSYDAKWTTGSVDDLGTVPVLHPQLPNAVAARVRRAAAEAFRAVGVRDYGRVDVRLAADGRPLRGRREPQLRPVPRAPAWRARPPRWASTTPRSSASSSATRCGVAAARSGRWHRSRS